MITEKLRSIYKKINVNTVHGSTEEKMPYLAQKKYLKKLPDPKDDFQRSFLKYKCFCEYCYYKKKWLVFIYNIGAMFMLPLEYARLKKRRKSARFIKKYDAVVENVPNLPNDDFIPDELTKNKSIKNIEEIDYSSSFLSKEAEKICKELKKKYFFYFYFRMIVTQKLALFSNYLKCYNPDVIAFYSCEREFTGPLQSLLCEKNNVKYVSFMHGDYISTLCFAYQRFSKYYVWDKSYVRMFNSLKCSSPMVIYTPKKFVKNPSKVSNENCEYYASYYFSDETESEMRKIKKVFDVFQNMGLKTKVRPHPRFSDIPLMKKIFKDITIEDTANYSLEDSIRDSRYIVGLCTTVLSEAYFSNKEIVIDNISNKKKYRELNERHYIMMKRPHTLLSDLIKYTNS